MWLLLQRFGWGILLRRLLPWEALISAPLWTILLLLLCSISMESSLGLVNLDRDRET